MKENEWKELDIGNLPSDILVGDYEWQFYNQEWKESSDSILEMLQTAGCGVFQYRYRKRQQKAPTHEEIMTKWWEGDTTWVKVEAYNPIVNKYYVHLGDSSVKWHKKDYFTNRQSAIIPPEEN